MQMHPRRFELVIEYMSLKRETSEPTEQRDAGNIKHPHSHSTILRKRILAALALFLMVLMFAIHNYHRSMSLRGAVDWRWFWVGEVFIAVWLVFVIAQVIRKGLSKRL
jgi:hypothetical protein